MITFASRIQLLTVYIIQQLVWFPQSPNVSEHLPWIGDCIRIQTACMIRPVYQSVNITDIFVVAVGVYLTVSPTNNK